MKRIPGVAGIALLLLSGAGDLPARASTEPGSSTSSAAYARFEPSAALVRESGGRLEVPAGRATVTLPAGRRELSPGTARLHFPEVRYEPPPEGRVTPDWVLGALRAALGGGFES